MVHIWAKRDYSFMHLSEALYLLVHPFVLDQYITICFAQQLIE